MASPGAQKKFATSGIILNILTRVDNGDIKLGMDFSTSFIAWCLVRVGQKILGDTATDLISGTET